MKITTLIVAAGLVSQLTEAATVTVTAGLPNTGILVTTDATPANFFMSVGQWDSQLSVWTPFGVPMLIIGELKGSVTAGAPTPLSGEIVSVFVGTAATPEACANGSFVILTSPTALLFPEATTSASVTFNASSSVTVSILFNGNANNALGSVGVPVGSSNVLNLVTVPETSTALLGALGALGLLRRRR